MGEKDFPVPKMISCLEKIIKKINQQKWNSHFTKSEISFQFFNLLKEFFLSTQIILFLNFKIIFFNFKVYYYLIIHGGQYLKCHGRKEPRLQVQMKLG